jgi:excisionase family DNA binding protein
MSIQTTGLRDSEQLVTSPKGAARLLDCGVTKIYELLNGGELETYRDGANRKIVVASIKQYIARKRAQPE